MKQKTVLTSSAQETISLGEAFAKTLRGGDVVALQGDLGSGKTTFTQGVARGLGIERQLSSPTFIIMRSFLIPSKKHMFYHVDLYRTEGVADAKGVGLFDIFEDETAITLIEWAEKIAGELPKKTRYLTFEYLNEESRKITYEED